jgi:DNA-binding MarR family transcriptional regulator
VARRLQSLQLSDYLPYRLSVAANAVSTLIAAAYKGRFDLPIPQWRLIAILSEHASLTQQQLVPLSTMDKQTVSRAARSLMQRELIARAANPLDRRAHRLGLTAAGRRLYRRLAPLALAYERQLLAGFSARRVATLQRQLLELEQAAQRLSTPER